MAGIPGAGKTEFVNNMHSVLPNFAPIEHDALVEFIEGYRPEDYYQYRKAGSKIVSTIFDLCIKNSYDFVFDGTLSHEQGAKNVRIALKAGYSINIIYIVQDIDKAWELTEAREIVKKRGIEREGFLQTCEKINKNLLNIFIAHKNNSAFTFWVIDKRGATDMANATMILHNHKADHSDEIAMLLSRNYTK